MPVLRMMCDWTLRLCAFQVVSTSACRPAAGFVEVYAEPSMPSCQHIGTQVAPLCFFRKSLMVTALCHCCRKITLAHFQHAGTACKLCFARAAVAKCCMLFCACTCVSIQSGAIGQLKSLEAKVLIPSYLFNKNDIRFKASLAGEGCLGDSPCECWVNCLLWSSVPLFCCLVRNSRRICCFFNEQDNHACTCVSCMMRDTRHADGAA
jgi:hypothetical protein